MRIAVSIMGVRFRWQISVTVDRVMPAIRATCALLRFDRRSASANGTGRVIAQRLSTVYAAVNTFFENFSRAPGLVFSSGRLGARRPLGGRQPCRPPSYVAPSDPRCSRSTPSRTCWTTSAPPATMITLADPARK